MSILMNTEEYGGMKKFIVGLFVVILTSLGCTEVQRQQVVSILSTDQYSAGAQPVQQAATVSNVKQAVMEAGDTPLIVASRQGDLKTVQTLLASGVDVNASNEKGTTALMAASKEGHADVIKALATHKKLDLNAMDWNSDTALMLAVQNNRLEAVKALLQAGADPNVTKAGMTALIAASYKGYADITRALLEGGANIDWVDENNESALDVAINTNKPAVVAVLREYQNKKM